MKLTPTKYAHALADLFESSTEPTKVAKNFLRTLSRRKQMKLLAKILQAFEKEWTRRKGTLAMRVWYPAQFPQAIGELESALSTQLGRSAHIQPLPSETLLGGFKILIEDTLIDASLEGRLKALAHKF